MNIQAFLHDEPASRVIFGSGSRDRVGAELDALGARRALVLTSPEQIGLGEQIAGLLSERCVGVYSGAVMHVPLDVARKAIEFARQSGADACVAVGGGSTIGLAKAIALETSLPILALPTTYAGSEMTPLYGITADGEKRTGRDWRVAPRTVIYDPQLSVGLPLAISVTSAINAIAHAAEGLYAHNASPVHRLMAEEGIRALATALPALQHAPTDIDARSNALYGAWLCGAVLGRVQMGLHHKLCHVLGGSFNLPHAELHTVMLPHALAYNASAAPQAMQALARALGSSDGITGLLDLSRALGAPRSLQEIGMPADGLDRAADLAVAAPYPNPRPLERTALRALLQRAFDGAEPR